MANELGAYSTVVMMNYNANYPEVYEYFRAEGKVGDNLKFENNCDWLSGCQLLKISMTLFRHKEITQENSKKLRI